MKAGTVILVDFQGARETKRRLALIVSTEIYHQARPDLILAVVTSNIDSANSPTDYLLADWKAAGLHKPSAFRSYFGTYSAASSWMVIGQLSVHDWSEVQSRLRLAIAVD